jgi:hypothetical protein
MFLASCSVYARTITNPAMELATTQIFMFVLLRPSKIVVDHTLFPFNLNSLAIGFQGIKDLLAGIAFSV